ncbi:MAG: hypothetical protein WAM14_14125 [Candidatus Nitrosopolaris sp.]
MIYIRFSLLWQIEICIFLNLSIHQTLTVDNAFRNYFQEGIKTNDTYLGNVIVAKAAANILSGVREAVIAVLRF